jgi:hypothetical protein
MLMGCAGGAGGGSAAVFAFEFIIIIPNIFACPRKQTKCTTSVHFSPKWKRMCVVPGGKLAGKSQLGHHHHHPKTPSCRSGFHFDLFV